MDRQTSPPARLRRACSWAVLAAALAAAVPARTAGGAENEYLDFVRARADALRAGDAPPRTRAGWEERRGLLGRQLADALGIPDGPAVPPEPRVVGTLDRDGYRVEKVVIRTHPALLMTANVYVPKAPGRHPAVLCVHGHWRGAKQDPTVQARCIGLAKLGFVVMVVDALGAGERAVGKALGEYHGESTAATLLPSGRTLAGLQVFENTRALAYLRGRPEVDGDHVGVTGASGGGNQTMYAAGLIDGFRAAAPVCSVGNYRAYLGTACCLCELVPGALTFADEWGVLGRFAPHPLLVVNASRDAVQFSVPEAKKTVAGLESVYALYDARDEVRHAVFESGHDYNQAMREAVYGWFTRALAGRGDGAPVAEPEVKAEDPEDLRCFPGDSRPEDFPTLPRFAAAEARRVLAARRRPDTAEGWKAEAAARREALVAATFGGFPAAPALGPEVSGDGGTTVIRFAPEPGLHLSARVVRGRKPGAPRAVLIDLDGAAHAGPSPLADALRQAGWGLVTLDLRATGALAWASDRVGNTPDHNTAEWGVWVGRPLLGQWAFDVRRLLDALEAADAGAGAARPSEVALVGVGPGGLVALAAAAVDARVSKVAAVDTLASYVSDVPYRGQRLGTIAPGILRTAGDVPDLAALVAPRRVVIAGGVSGGGPALDAARLTEHYRPAARAWDLLGAAGALKVLGGAGPAEVVEALR